MTESPLNVDAGACVVEASFFDWRLNNGVDSYTVMATNFKLGITNNMDLQTVVNACTGEDPKTGAGAEGISNVLLRLKYNVWGSDGGDSAFAIFPVIEIPTGSGLSNGEVEGGLILPFGMDLVDRISLGLWPNSTPFTRPRVVVTISICPHCCARIRSHRAIRYVHRIHWRFRTRALPG